MKKILFVTLFAVCASGAFAQINKGQWLAGGNVAFQYNKTGNSKYTQFNVSPDAGYFFIDNFAGGLRVNVDTYKSKINDVETGKQTTFSIAPFVRYYFLPSGQKVNIFADADYSFGSTKYGNAESTSVNGFGFMAGPAIFLTPNTALEFTVGYNSIKYEGSSNRTNSIRVGAGFQIHLGNPKK
jgi:hypothetical protein